MKYFFLVGFYLLSIVFSFGQENIEKHLLFSPQEMEVKSETSSINLAQIDTLTKVLKKSISQRTAGKWALDSIDKPIEMYFEIDAGLGHFDEFHLQLKANKIRLTAKNKNGLAYGKQTLLHLLKYAASEERSLPEIEIKDWADFERRGYMLDISRDKVPTMESLYALIDQLAGWRYNEFQLYTEHTFAYRNHKKVWKDASPLTA